MDTNTPFKPGLLLAFVAVAAVAGAAGWSLSHVGHGPAAPTAAAPAASAARQVLYWYDPMKPEARFDKPGKSPFMDMQLVPRYADEAVSGGVRVDPRVSQSLGMRLATVAHGTLEAGFTASGSLVFNDRDVAIVQARSGGFVERVVPRAPGDLIAAGAVLAEVLVPEWAGAQQEYLALRRSGDTALAAAARQRLALLGMPEALVQQVEASGQPQAVTPITSPMAGVIQELMVRPGMSLAPGMTLARINGIGTMWLEAAVPEAQAALLAPGRVVKATLAAYPGELLEGRVAAVLPEANKDTRTLRVRIELPNRNGRLKAGLVAMAQFTAPGDEALLVPSEAVIRTGQRNLVFVVGEQPGQYSAVDVELGRESAGRIAVLKGLQAGQQVVASGQFLIDSEASVSGVTGRNSPAAPVVHEVNAIVEGVEGGEIMVQHEPVPALKWPAMSMPFALKSPQQAAGLKAGDRVRLAFVQGGSGPVVERLTKQAGAPASGASR